MTAVLAPTEPVVTVRRGWAYWLDGYRCMLRWHLASLRLWLTILMAVQVLAGVGFVLGIGLFFADIPASAALYVSTGVPVVNLVMVGLILGPQLVAEQKSQQSYDFLQSLPVPRTAAAAAWYTVTLAGGIPAVLVSLLVAWVRYDLRYAVSATIVPAMLLTAFTGTMMGYALAHAISNPTITRLGTNLLTWLVFSFSPVLFPVEQMPSWLGRLSHWLPFEHMAVIVRDSLTDGSTAGVGTSYAVVASWGAACAATAALALGRRR